MACLLDAAASLSTAREVSAHTLSSVEVQHDNECSYRGPARKVSAHIVRGSPARERGLKSSVEVQHERWMLISSVEVQHDRWVLISSVEVQHERWVLISSVEVQHERWVLILSVDVEHEKWVLTSSKEDDEGGREKTRGQLWQLTVCSTASSVNRGFEAWFINRQQQTSGRVLCLYKTPVLPSVPEMEGTYLCHWGASFSEDVPLDEIMYLVFTRMPGDICDRLFRFLMVGLLIATWGIWKQNPSPEVAFLDLFYNCWT